MKTVMVKEVYNIGVISQGKIWSKLVTKLNEILTDSNEEYILDFKGIELYEPWKIKEFRELLAMDNIKIKVTSNDSSYLDKFKRSTESICYLCNYKSNKVIKELIEVKPQKSKEDIDIENKATAIENEFVLENIDGTEYMSIDISNKYTQLGTVKTINVLYKAINRLHSEKGYINFIIKIGKIDVQDNIIKKLGKCIVDFKHDGINLSIDTDVNSVLKGISMYIHKHKNNELSEEEKLEMMYKIPKHRVGILCTYRKGRKIDDFGRKSDGEVSASRIAIFQGLFVKGTSCNKLYKVMRNTKLNEYMYYANNKWYKANASNIVLKFHVYNSKYMFTHCEWLLEHDNELYDEEGNELTALKYIEITCGINDVGYQNKFCGKEHHFMRVKQQSEEENKVMIVDIDKDERSIKEMHTIPEWVKIIFDDWKVQYNVDYLNKDIEYTRKELYGDK